ncbi:MAG TPA: putative N-acetylmannosamine-6-phosphate 2-epimerase [Terracidiphilus sp.]|nr:putative N-acetylmannosamine-6-phosphate 2-epimerase [Terracidiphilus sp.]
MMSTIQEQLKGKLVASCQAAPGDPLEDTETIRRIARAVIAAGAGGLRINSAEHIAAIRQDTEAPVIGIQKRYVDGILRITPDFASAEALAKAGASIVALDCTDRAWAFGEPWRQLIERIHGELKLPVMADVATFDEALAASKAGADFVGTTLNGYTRDTQQFHSFNWSLLADLTRQIKTPIIAEGQISTPAEAKRAISEGAWCVVVGSAITRPGTIAASFVRALQVPSLSSSAVGIDIGGTSIKAGIVSREGSVSHATQAPTEAARGRDAIAAGLIAVVEQILDKVHRERIEICGLGIASAGAIDARDGSVFAATENLPGWAGFELRAFVEQRFHLPVFVVNDAHAAALAELHFGLGRNLSDFVAITIGTGIGGGIVSGGKLLQGQHGFAGTVGHQTIRVDGRPCNCGRRGCLEAYVSTASLLKEYAEQSGRSPDPTIGATALAREISHLAIAGDPAARSAYAALAGYLAEGLANIFNLLDPQAVFISGGLVEGHQEFVADIESRVTKSLHFGAKRSPRIQLAAQGHYSGVQGAAAMVFGEQTL